MKKLFVLLILSVLLLSSSCGLLPEEVVQTPPPSAAETKDIYVFAEAVMGDVVYSESSSAKAASSKFENLAFTVAGIVIENMYVEIGDVVSEGDILAELSNVDLKEQLVTLKEQLTLLELQLTNLNTEYINSRNRKQITLDAATDEARIASLKAEMESDKKSYNTSREILVLKINNNKAQIAEKNESLNDRILRAGISGIITKRFDVGENQLSKAGEVLITISDTSTARIILYDESVPKFSDGEKASVTYQGGEFTGVLRMDSDGKLIVVPDKPINDITDGTTYTIVVVKETKKSVLLVSTLAIKFLEDKAVVYRLNDNGIVEMVPVTVGISDGVMTEIVSGLSAGDSVIVSIN